MSKFWLNFRKHKIAYIVCCFIALIIGGIAFMLYYFLKNKTMLDAINGVTISFVSLLAIGAFIWLRDLGAFDVAMYGFRQLFTSAFSKKPNKYNDYPAYAKAKNVERASSANLQFSFLFVALLFAIALAVLEAIYHS